MHKRRIFVSLRVFIDSEDSGLSMVQYYTNNIDFIDLKIDGIHQDVSTRKTFN